MPFYYYYFFCLFLFLLFLVWSNSLINTMKDNKLFYLGMAMGWARIKDGVFVLIPHDFVLPHPRLILHDRENFLTPSLPLGAPPHPIKLYFLLIFPTTSTIFLMKPISLIKIYLKLQLNLSHQIKLIFRKNWIIYPII